MQIFYTPDINSIGEHSLPPDESAHAVRVLRLGAGAVVRLADGRGGMFEAVVVRPDPRACLVRVLGFEAGFGARGYSLVMGVAPTKNAERFEWFLEKATEIGLDAVVPLLCDASERRVFNAARAKRVLVSAMKQSLKASLPVLEPPTPVRELIARPFDGLRLIAHCRADSPTPRVPVAEALRAGAALILIGPEGDFSRDEVSLALEAGFVPVSLGSSRLRTETAALVAVTAAYLNYGL